MDRADLADLAAFMAVAEARSFTRAAARLGTSQSALSHVIRRLEARLGVRLLARTTRTVATTDAGERLLRTLGPALEDIDAGLDALSELRDKPAGTIRIVAPDHAAEWVLWPALEKLLPNYPEINVEICADNGFSDIVADRFDAGVRLGEHLAKDMIAVPISGEMRLIVVGAPSYFEANQKPRTPRDLAGHECINIRLPTSGGFYAWEFGKNGREVRVRVEGRLAFNKFQLAWGAALAGYGLAFVPEDCVQRELAAGQLVQVLDDWCKPYPGFYLYYPSRRQQSPAFTVIVDGLRHRA